MESSGRIDEHDHPDAYGAILDAMRFVAAAPHPTIAPDADLAARLAEQREEVLPAVRQVDEDEGLLGQRGKRQAAACCQ